MNRNEAGDLIFSEWKKTTIRRLDIWMCLAMRKYACFACGCMNQKIFRIKVSNKSEIIAAQEEWFKKPI